MKDEEATESIARYLRQQRRRYHMFELRTQLVDDGWPPRCIEAAEVQIYGRPMGMRATSPAVQALRNFLIFCAVVGGNLTGAWALAWLVVALVAGGNVPTLLAFGLAIAVALPVLAAQASYAYRVRKPDQGASTAIACGLGLLLAPVALFTVVLVLMLVLSLVLTTIGGF